MTSVGSVAAAFRRFRQRSHVVSVGLVSKGVTRLVVVSPLSETRSEIDLPTDALVKWIGGGLIQDTFPELSGPQRELLMTGYTDDDWATMFPPEEDS